MKILMVCHYYYPYRSGVTEYMRLLAEGLGKRGHEVTVLTSKSSKEYPAREIHEKVSIIRLPVLIRIDRACIMPALLPNIYSLSRHFDIINLHLPFPDLYPAALLLKKKRVVFTYHCDINLRGNSFFRILESIYYRSLRSSLEYARAVVLNSQEYFEYSRIKGSSCRAVFIYPPIKPMERKDPSALREELKIGDAPVIGFAGRLVFEKGIEYLIEAFGIVKRFHPDARLVIGGDHRVAGISAREGLLTLAERYRDDICFPGFIPDDRMEEFYSLCDVFVLPSVDSFESFGMVQVEAMLCGTPVIATTLPGVTVPVKRTGMGILVPPRDKNALARAIIDILSNKVKYTVARKKILEEFSVERTIDEYERLFLSLCRT